MDFLIALELIVVISILYCVGEEVSSFHDTYLFINGQLDSRNSVLYREKIDRYNIVLLNRLERDRDNYEKKHK